MYKPVSLLQFLKYSEQKSTEFSDPALLKQTKIILTILYFPFPKINYTLSYFFFGFLNENSILPVTLSKRI